jgi:hypothetical protein
MKGQNTHIIYIEVHICIRNNTTIIVDHMCLMLLCEECNLTQEHWINIKSQQFKKHFVQIQLPSKEKITQILDPWYCA